MESISAQRRGELLSSARDVVKLELRDHYAMDAETLEAYRCGDHDVVKAAYAETAEEIADMLASGRSWRRVRVVSEPLSEYQRMAVEFSGVAVDAGEELRWLPRRLVSAVALPGNDCFVLDGLAAMFNILDGTGDRADIQYSADPAVVRFCADAFATAWTLATPHRDYHPE
ncbi:hypothetical protein SMC26_37920 [Actinomadura fulvescens]|uniref:DUF6879 domain-containing protein n=1 Tax=Actinomadura fulvescens TaxID=46160 RepID=A0ABP6CLK3_9ACTN